MTPGATTVTATTTSRMSGWAASTSYRIRKHTPPTHPWWGRSTSAQRCRRAAGASGRPRAAAPTPRPRSPPLAHRSLGQPADTGRTTTAPHARYVPRYLLLHRPQAQRSHPLRLLRVEYRATAPKNPPKSSQDASKRLPKPFQEPPRADQEYFVLVQEASKRLPRGLQETSRRPPGPI